MPEAGDIAPVVGGPCLFRARREHFRGELGGPEGDFIEVAVGGVKPAAVLAGLSPALGRSVAKRREQQFPFGRITGEIRMGVGECMHDKGMGGATVSVRLFR